MTELQQWVSLARILRPQGRRGEVLAEITTDFPQRFAELKEAFLQRASGAEPQPTRLETSWLHKGRVVLKFAGVESISDAELLREARMVVPADARASLAEDAVYISDLVGCALFDRSGGEPQPVGSIRDVIPQADAADLLVVVSAAGVEHWIPFARAYSPSIDLRARRMEMTLPPGLLAMNGPLSEEERLAQQAEQNAARD